MKGRSGHEPSRKSGDVPAKGAIVTTKPPSVTYQGKGSKVAKEAKDVAAKSPEERAAEEGAMVEGKTTISRLDRKPRKKGGKVMGKC